MLSMVSLVLASLERDDTNGRVGKPRLLLNRQTVSVWGSLLRRAEGAKHLVDIG